MDDKQWDDYIRRQPGTFWGNLASDLDRKRQQAWNITSPALPRRTARRGNEGQSADRSKGSALGALVGLVGGTGIMYAEFAWPLIPALLVGIVAAAVLATWFWHLVAIGVFIGVLMALSG